MKKTLTHFLTAFFVTIGWTACESKSTLATVGSVDLKRYAGTWYEVASYPRFFERGCSNVKATYTPAKGYIEVFNQSIKNKKPNNIKGKAFVVGNSGNAKLKVQFFWPFKGDYWIIDLAGDYSWAIVSNPNRSTLWILSRSPKMEEKLYNSLVAKLEAKGFNKNKIVKMVQE
ncbi:MAG: lipocalin family protein [Bacteroidota bacterium]|nr:lipocalin family protein [Bacteroidota bacterium]